jgi:hypothetical protein
MNHSIRRRVYAILRKEEGRYVEVKVSEAKIIGASKQLKAGLAVAQEGRSGWCVMVLRVRR